MFELRRCLVIPVFVFHYHLLRSLSFLLIEKISSFSVSHMYFLCREPPYRNTFRLSINTPSFSLLHCHLWLLEWSILNSIAGSTVRQGSKRKEKKARNRGRVIDIVSFLCFLLWAGVCRIHDNVGLHRRRSSYPWHQN